MEFVGELVDGLQVAVLIDDSLGDDDRIVGLLVLLDERAQVVVRSLSHDLEGGGYVEVG